MIKDMRQSTTSMATTDTSASPETSKSQDDLKRPSSTLAEKAKKKNWYNVIYPSYKSRSDDFKKLFSIPEDERLLVGKFHTYAFSENRTKNLCESASCL